MVILLEGVDGTGKTTLYEQLKGNFGFNFIKALPRDESGQYLWWKKKIESPYVYFMDRGFISELVYRPVKDDEEPNITLEEIGSLCGPDLLIVYCNCKYAWNNTIIRGDDYISSKSEHQKLSERYENVIDSINWFTNARILFYDYKKDDVVNSYEFVLHMIQEFIDRRKRYWSGQQTKY